MPLITLTSDIGQQDYLVGAIKGRLLRINSAFEIVDVSHNLSPFNYPQAAYVCRSAFKNFPEYTFHIVLVNLFESKPEQMLLAFHKDQYIVCADNGLLGMILEERPDMVKGLIALEPSGFPPEASRAALKTVPTIIVLGDNRAPGSNDAPKALTSYLSSLGGDATTYLLPEHGISGNGHMMMMESNSEQIADLLEDWIKRHVPSASMTTPASSSTGPTK